ncbi:restriction endonuclease subunit S [Methanobrevibacter sp.]
MKYERIELNELCSLSQGLQIPIAKRFREDGDNRYFYITVQFLKDSSDKYFIENPPERVKCNSDDILVVRTGNTGQIITGVEGCFHNNFFKVEPNEKIYSKFLYYTLKSPELYTRMRNVASGTTILDLKHSAFLGLDIYLPNMDNQKKIAYILEIIDQKIVICESINKNLEELAKSIYRYHFIDFEPYSQDDFISSTIGKIPENWSVQSIGGFVDDMKNGGTPKRCELEYWENGTVPWLKTGEINNNIIIKSEEHITEMGLKNSSAKLLPINSIIMALYGKGTAARIGLLKLEATTNQACCAMICNDFNKTLFLYLFLLFNQKEIENLASGSVQQNLSKDLIANLELVVPPIEIIENLPFKEIYDKIASNYFEIEYLTNLRDTLLPKLMSGEIDVSKINCD